MGNQQSPLSMNVRLTNADGTPTLEFMRKWQTQVTLNAGIKDLSTVAAVSGVLDVIDASPGSILLRTTSLWSGLVSPVDGTRYLRGTNPPAYGQVRDSDIALSDVLTGDVGLTSHGFAPKLSGLATEFLDGTGAYTTPPASGDMLKSVYDINADGVVDAAATSAALTGAQAADIVTNNAKVSDINHVVALLPNVDNTSDAAKPVSVAQQAALDAKETSLGNPAADGDVLASTIAGVRSWVVPGSGGGATTFVGLTDTPAALGTTGQAVQVNAGATALEFVTPAAAATTFVGLTDTPTALGTAGQAVQVNAGATALEFVTPATGGSSISILPKTANYTLVNSDLAGSKLITMSVATANAIVVPLGLTGTEPLKLIAIGTGQTTVSAVGGVTVSAADGYLSLRTQFSTARLLPNGANNYILSGDLVQTPSVRSISSQPAYLLAGQAPAASVAISSQPAYLLAGQAPAASVALSKQVIYIIGA